MSVWTYTLGEIAAMGGVLAPEAHRGTVVTGVSKDTRTIKPGDLYIAIKGEHFDADEFVDDAFAKGAAAAITTAPHDAGPTIVTEEPLKALQRFSSAHRDRFGIPVLGITGSCGKTTAKDLAAALLAAKYTVVKTQGNYNNEIGCPLSLLQLGPDTTFAVIEMGANHQQEIARMCAWSKPTESVITMIGPAHLEGFGGTLEHVQKAKGEIMEALDPRQHTFYVNNDDDRCRAVGKQFGGRTITFGRGADIALKRVERIEDGDLLLDVAPIGPLRLPLPSRAHVGNVLFAIAVAHEHGIADIEEPLRAACKALTRVKLEQAGPLRVIDDSYNANPASMRAALETLSEVPAERRIAALGGMLELGEAAPAYHVQLGRDAAEFGVEVLYVRGDFAGHLARGAREAGVPDVHHVDEHAEIAHMIAADAREGDVLLLKGSRGMTMERILAALRRHYEEGSCSTTSQ